MIGSNCFNLDVLWEEVVAVGPVVKHNLVERGCGQFHHLAVVVTAIFVFTDNPLSDCQLPHGSLVALGDRNRVLIIKAYQATVPTVTGKIRGCGATNSKSINLIQQGLV